jgi:DNA-binding transcriptional ArsR family regulator
MSEAAAGVRVSVSELATLKGVSPQAISKRLGRLEEQGLINVSKVGRERTVLLADWDTVTSEHSDLSKLAGAATLKERSAESLPGADFLAKRDPTYTAELTRKAGYEADLKAIELRRLKGELVEVDELRAAAETAATTIVGVFDRLPALAEDIGAAMTKGGVSSVRDALKNWVRMARADLARACEQLARAGQEKAAHHEEEHA